MVLSRLKPVHYLIIALVITAACHRPITTQRQQPAASEAIRLNNLGVARMNQGRAGEALELFRQAWQRDGSLFAARLNEGIALLNTQRFDEAREVLLDATRRQPNSARAWYNLGI